MLRKKLSSWKFPVSKIFYILIIDYMYSISLNLISWKPCSTARMSDPSKFCKNLLPINFVCKFPCLRIKGFVKFQLSVTFVSIGSWKSNLKRKSVFLVGSHVTIFFRPIPLDKLFSPYVTKVNFLITSNEQNLLKNKVSKNLVLKRFQVKRLGWVFRIKKISY